MAPLEVPILRLLLEVHWFIFTTIKNSIPKNSVVFFVLKILHFPMPFGEGILMSDKEYFSTRPV